jgi:hypothetical protein
LLCTKSARPKSDQGRHDLALKHPAEGMSAIAEHARHLWPNAIEREPGQCQRASTWGRPLLASANQVSVLDPSRQARSIRARG